MTRPSPDLVGRAGLACAVLGSVLAAALVVLQLYQPPPVADDALVVRVDYRAGWLYADQVARFPDTAPGWPLDAPGLEAACASFLNHRHDGPDRVSFMAGCIDRTRQEGTP